MKARAAVLHAVGAPPALRAEPAAADRGDRHRPAGPRRGPRARACRGPLPLRPLGHQRRPPAARCRWRWATRPPARSSNAGRSSPTCEPGDHVVMVFVPSCGHCVPCMEGPPRALRARRRRQHGRERCSAAAAGSRWRGKPVNHHMGVSAFAEYAVVSRRSLVKIDPTLAFDEAALFGCAVLTGVGAVVNTAKLTPGTTAAVVGLGGVGMNSVLGRRALRRADRRRRRPVRRQARARAAPSAPRTPSTPAAPDAIEQVREAERRRRRLRLRDGGLGAGDGTRLPHHAARAARR